MKTYLLIGLIAAVTTFVLTPLVRRIAIDVGAVTKVRERDIHSEPTPRMGGIAMLIGLLVSFIFAHNTEFLEPVFHSDIQIIPIIGGAIGISVLGALDDIFDLDWTLRLAVQILIASVVTWGGVQIISLPFMGLIVSSYRTNFILSVLIIVAVMNAVNFIDGLDGLAAGIILISSSSFFVYSYLLNHDMNSYSSLAALLSISLAGICFGFLFHNFHKSRIFMGDSGSMLLGFLMACNSIIVTGRVDPSSSALHSLSAFMPIVIPLLVLLFPFLDMILAIVRRVAKGKSPFHPDKKHIHHKMLMIGHSQTVSVIILYAWTALLSVGGVVFYILNSPIVLIVVAACLFVLLVITFYPRLLHFLERLKNVNSI
jgi:UDP-GlcNAc:undecaprenyl-phosphate GlcNAc-1-phosphate transferase